MSDAESAPDDGIAQPNPPAGTNHNEALIAALLGSQRLVQQPAERDDEPGVTEPGRTTPLTASSVIGHTAGGDSDTAERREVPSEHGGDAGRGEPGSGGPPADADTAEPVPPIAGDGDDEEASFTKSVLEWMVVLGAAAVVAIILRTFVFQAFYIPSESMEQTLYQGDRILVNKVSYRLHDINRGDVVVFRRPDDQPGDIRDLIKRVIGLPGDVVEGRNSQIYVNGQLLVEPYLHGDSFADFGPITVPDGEYFMMGDNRDQSLDSRRFGTIAEDRVIGRAFVLFWPVDRVGLL